MEGFEQKSQSSGKQVLIIFGVVMIGLMLIGGGIFVSRRALQQKGAFVKPIVAPAEIKKDIEPTPVVEVTRGLPLDRADLVVQILNGSGVPGLASKAQDFLTPLGYKEIKIGNAKKYDYPETVIQIKEDKNAYLDMIKKDLSVKYTLAQKIETLSKDSEFDLVIILGKK